MGEIDGESRVSESPSLASENTVFDASQYEFFGKNVTEEVELGGLEEDGDDTGLIDFDDKDYRTLPKKDREEVESIGLFSDVDDLSSTFSKINRTVSEPRITGNLHGRGSISRESSFAAEWTQEPDFSNWLDQHILDAEYAHDTKRWSSHPYPFPPESKPLYRTSSYPQQPHQQQQQNISTEAVPIPKSPFTSYPPQVIPPIPFSAPNLSHFSPPPHLAPGLPHGLQFAGGSMSQFGPPGLPIHSRQPNPNHWPNQAGLLPGLHNPNGIMHHRLHQVQPPSPNFSNLQSQLYASHHPTMVGMAESREPRVRPLQRGRQNARFPQQGSDDPEWPQFRSKYMCAEEIDSILRIQHAATHSNDPYVDDYYHQACLAKRYSSSNSRPRHHFCPVSIRDLPSHTKASSEPHAYLQVDALGRIPFSSIRRPRPLLEVDAPANSADEILNPKSAIKPLEQEPMLAARIIIEDGICLLLDVDDIDRLLQFGAPQDGGAHLRRRRQGLLEGLAASLQLVDPLGHGIAPKDDLVFLRCVSLPKGRKLLSRYLKILYPCDDLARIVCMAVFRHLRFLFGEMPMDSVAAKTTTDLVISVASVVHGMDLGALSACLAAIVCSSEQPPLRPIGNPAGDGASVITKAVLERATELLTDRHAAANHSIRNLWQESFDAFFVLLTKYCISKYESIMESLVSGAPNAAPIGPEVAKAISREMPVELLRASLPHTNESQRKLLLEFAQRSMPVT